MDPYQAPTPPPNPYDFITKPQAPAKKPLFSGGSFKSRLLFVVGGAIVFMIIAMVVVSLLGASGSGTTNAMKDLVATQEEIIRIADIGAKDGLSASTRAFGLTTALSVKSQQLDFKSYLEQKDTVVSKELLASQKDRDIDSTLEEAKANNRFDDVFTETLTRKLATYENQLEATYNDTKNETARNILKSSFSSTTALLEASEE